MDRTNFNTLLKSFSMEENFIKFGCFWKHILIFFANLSENIWQNCVLSQTCHFLLGYIRDVLEVCRLMRRMEGHSSLTHISQRVMQSGAPEIGTGEEKRLDLKIHSWRQIKSFAKYKVLEVCRLMRRMEGYSSLTHSSQKVINAIKSSRNRHNRRVEIGLQNTQLKTNTAIRKIECSEA